MHVNYGCCRRGAVNSHSPVCWAIFGMVTPKRTTKQPGTWDLNMHQEKKMFHGKFFDFRAQKCIKNWIPRDQNPPIKGF